MEKKVDSIWALDEFADLKQLFDDRRAKLRKLERYYTGLPKEVVGDNGIWGSAWHLQLPLERAKKEAGLLFQPLAGAVHADVALVGGGWELEKASKYLENGVIRVLKMSRWGLEQAAYIHNGATMGCTTLKVVDDHNGKRVVIQPIRPDMVLPIPANDYDPRLKMAILVGESWHKREKLEVVEVIEPDRVRTYVDGKLTGLGGRKDTFPNALGEVNIIDVPFIYIGKGLGEPTYQAALTPLEGINRQAQDLQEQIRRHIEPQWAAFIEEPERNASDLQKSGDNLWWFPRGSDIKALVAALDIPGVMELIREVKSELKENLPELLIFKLVGVNRVAVPAVEIQLLPLTLKIHRIRQSLDCGLEDALRMAGRAFKRMNAAHELQALDDEMLGFNAQRPVIFMDALSALSVEQSKLGVEAQKQSLQQLAALSGDGIESDE